MFTDKQNLPSWNLLKQRKEHTSLTNERKNIFHRTYLCSTTPVVTTRVEFNTFFPADSTASNILPAHIFSGGFCDRIGNSNLNLKSNIIFSFFFSPLGRFKPMESHSVQEFNSSLNVLISEREPSNYSYTSLQHLFLHSFSLLQKQI